MTDVLRPLNNYMRAIQRNLEAGNSTEHTHRPALKALLEAIGDGVVATNEPRRIECGAPDFVLAKGAGTIGYLEAKDVGKSLDEAEGSDQVTRYRQSLSNLVLTDYIELRWYVNGERRLVARLGVVSGDGRIARDKTGTDGVTSLLAAFLAHEGEVTGSPKDLALRLARMAHMIRGLIVAAFEKELLGGSLHAQFTAFRDNLIPDLSPEQFADMYAQTIAYGLFAARCAADSGKDFTRQNAAYLLPKTNPFLRKLFSHIAGPELDDRIAWLVDDLAWVLNKADMAAILEDFGRRTAKEDPVVHFYETFLAAYDPKMREMRGVYYTPVPVVSYIVRSVDYLLKTRFGKADGLADPDTLILDPAVGTATFLYAVINEINEAMTRKGQAGLWNDYVAEKLLSRLFGFELLMAPYAVAHLKLGLLLQETGYRFQSDQRLGIYLTNTLEEAIKRSEALFATWITEEANAAAEIKREKPIMVVLGNPPYSGHSANKGEWARQLVAAYKMVDGHPLGEKNPKWLQDDYVKFIRFGQWRIERTGRGILAFITNHSYLDNPTFRGMRQSLMNTFSDIYILDLHGNSKKRETMPDGGKDENVFDIQQGVAIALFVKEAGKPGPAKVHHGDLWGPREAKYGTLSEAEVSATDWEQLEPHSPFYLFVVRQEARLAEYKQGWKITEAMPVNVLGFQTHRDDFAIDFESNVLHERIDKMREKHLSDDEFRERYGLRDNRDWHLADARAELRKDEQWQDSLIQCLYRPFDWRQCYFSATAMDCPRRRLLEHVAKKDNSCLLLPRQIGTVDWRHACVTRHVPESCVVSAATKEQNYVFPLYLYPSEQEVASGLYKASDRRPNLKPEFVKAFSEKLGLKFIEDGRGDLKESFGPEDIFNYAYAVFHSPTYRSRYADFLKTDFPRLPLTSDMGLFEELCRKGAELVALHLMESSALSDLITAYPVSGSDVVERVDYSEVDRRVRINKTQYFEGVPPEVWSFHVGSYQVCQKWLKDRKGRKLSYDERLHYERVVVALKETIRIMAEIDGVIPGWSLP